MGNNLCPYCRLIDADDVLLRITSEKEDNWKSCKGKPNEYDIGVNNGLTLAHAIVLGTPPVEVPRWIPVTERLPTEEDGSRYGDVWAVQKNSHADTWHWEYVRKHPQRFTHWMPLPGDPEKE